jgi:hypothetical protein
MKHEITKKEYLKLAKAIEDLYNLICDNGVITPRVYQEAVTIYNNAEIRTFSEDESEKET